jgi:SAM-dependent methyltransferase
MKEEIIRKLLSLNREFYQTFAACFSDTRMRLQPGVKKMISSVPFDANILDLGCGNGELAHTLARRGHQGQYLGLDFSPDLLGIARDRLAKFRSISFIQADLSSSEWDTKVIEFANDVMEADQFDFVLAFASFHHLPGRDIHIQTFKKVFALLNEEGRLIHSNWQFLKSERLRKRIQSWSRVGLTAEDVDPGDYLLDWRRGGYGLRYVHYFSPEALRLLAEETGFNVVECFYSDGEGGNLGLYQVWKKGT